jgi:tRNA pseudouridine38-40 synthase
MRIAIGIEYDGRPFAGWQRQGHAMTVQQAVEDALAKVADHPVSVLAAGRTDAGVHALQQVAHFDTTASRQMRAWILGANSNLPRAVGLTWAQPVSDEFHARFKAQRRRYRYLIHNRMTRSPLLDGRVTWIHRDLDVARMARAAAHLVGTHDFSSYRAQECQAKSPVKTVRHLTLQRRGELIELDIEADGFLHHMVRNIAGVLIAIGSGDQEIEWSKEVLEARDRSVGGVTAPPDGLYFIEPTYPAEFAIPRLSSHAPLW